MRRISPRSRAGFTLVELLTVIAIIGILVSLLLVAVIGVGSKGVDLKCTNELRQFSEALDNFKGKFGSYPPSRVTLSAAPNRMDPLSLAFVTAVWPRIDFNNPSSPIDWAGALGTVPGTSVSTLNNTTYVLEGDQCLVFFLSGIPNQTAAGSWGFSSNPKNPTDIGTGTKESFYQFESARLYARPTSKTYGVFGDKLKFYSFQDPYSTSQPYVYFSAGRSGYNPAPGDNPALMPFGPYVEAVSANGKIVPTTPLRYIQSTRFQIISAGKDGLFGPGGLWSPALATSIPVPGLDDMVSFYDAKLGVPQ